MSSTVMGSEAAGPKMSEKPHIGAVGAFLVVLVAGIVFAAFSVFRDISQVGETNLAIGTFMLLGLALLIALGFEFVNGFHDTANAVATVIYTHSLPPLVAVIWSGTFNFLGVLTSSGAVAYSIVTLLPVELILQVGSGAGYAMIFALLLAAIIWNLGTWAFGLPNSSSHALIGSIMGVGLANQLMAPAGRGASGVQWGQAGKVFESLAFSPVIGFLCAGGLLLVMKAVIRNKTLYTAPVANKPPPLWIRSLLVFTCTGVSFAHGGNDGQKGMGLIMLILIGAAPTAYALNRAIPASTTPAFEHTIQAATAVFTAHDGGAALPDTATARADVGVALKAKQVNNPALFADLASLTTVIGQQVQNYGAISNVPAAATPNVRNDMYLAAEAVRVMGKHPAGFSGDEMAKLSALQGWLQRGTRFIPTWVKITVALALGLGTMVGWKRIVVTVGEKIGKTHLTYAQGAAAELVAMATIGAAELYGLPVSTTHILSSGVAGTMAANGSGLQWGTVRNMAMAWVMTLPAAMLISGTLYFIFRHLF